jgi:hypothetical protein
MRSPLLVLHIVAGTLGMLSGFVAVFLRKGSRQHALAGKCFVTSMLILSSSGVFLAIMKSQVGNILGGTITFYLVATGWMTARRQDGKIDTFDWGALLASIVVATLAMSWGFEAVAAGSKHGYPPGPYFFLGSVAVLAALGDLRMVARGGISGTQRVARHLWRMCFGLFIAAASIFMAREHLFPVFMRKTGMLVFLSVLPLILLIYWLIRVRLTKAYTGNMISRVALDPIAR